VEHVAYVCGLSGRTDPAVEGAGGPDSRIIEFGREFPLSARRCRSTGAESRPAPALFPRAAMAAMCASKPRRRAACAPACTCRA